MTDKVVAINQQDVSDTIRIFDDNTGIPVTGLDDTSTGLQIWYIRGEDNAIVTDGGSAADLPSLGAAHSDWGLSGIGKGYYRVCLPDAAFLEDEGKVTWGMDATGYTCVAREITIEPAFRFQGTPDATTATTTTFPTGVGPQIGETIRVVRGTGDIGNEVLVTAVAGDVATHEAFSTSISSSTTTVLLIAGDEITAQGGINCDDPVSDTATPTDVANSVDTALTNYDVAVNDDMEGFFQLAMRSDAAIATDRSVLLGRINADEGSGAGDYDNTLESLEHSNVKHINDAVVNGNGTSGNKWRGS